MLFLKKSTAVLLCASLLTPSYGFGVLGFALTLRPLETRNTQLETALSEQAVVEALTEFLSSLAPRHTITIDRAAEAVRSHAWSMAPESEEPAENHSHINNEEMLQHLKAARDRVHAAVRNDPEFLVFINGERQKIAASRGLAYEPLTMRQMQDQVDRIQLEIDAERTQNATAFVPEGLMVFHPDYLASLTPDETALSYGHELGHMLTLAGIPESEWFTRLHFLIGVHLQAIGSGNFRQPMAILKMVISETDWPEMIQSLNTNYHQAELSADAVSYWVSRALHIPWSYAELLEKGYQRPRSMVARFLEELGIQTHPSPEERASYVHTTPNTSRAAEPGTPAIIATGVKWNIPRPVAFEQATEKDLDDLVLFRRTAMKNRTRGDPRTTENDFLKVAKSILAGPSSGNIVLAKNRGRIVGFAMTYIPTHWDQASLFEVAVQPGWRGLKLSRALTGESIKPALAEPHLQEIRVVDGSDQGQTAALANHFLFEPDEGKSFLLKLTPGVRGRLLEYIDHPRQYHFSPAEVPDAGTAAPRGRHMAAHGPGSGEPLSGEEILRNLHAARDRVHAAVRGNPDFLKLVNVERERGAFVRGVLYKPLSQGELDSLLDRTDLLVEDIPGNFEAYIGRYRLSVTASSRFLRHLTDEEMAQGYAHELGHIVALYGVPDPRGLERLEELLTDHLQEFLTALNEQYAVHAFEILFDETFPDPRERGRLVDQVNAIYAQDEHTGDLLAHGMLERAGLRWPTASGTGRFGPDPQLLRRSLLLRAVGIETHPPTEERLLGRSPQENPLPEHRLFLRDTTLRYVNASELNDDERRLAAASLAQTEAEFASATKQLIELLESPGTANRYRLYPFRLALTETGEVAGFTQIDLDTLELKVIEAFPPYRGQHLGSQLYRNALAEFLASGKNKRIVIQAPNRTMVENLAKSYFTKKELQQGLFKWDQFNLLLSLDTARETIRRVDKRRQRRLAQIAGAALKNELTPEQKLSAIEEIYREEYNRRDAENEFPAFKEWRQTVSSEGNLIGVFEESRFADLQIILNALGLHPGQLLIDLGSGDGRVPLVAGAVFGADAIGVEADPRLHELAVALRQRASESVDTSRVQLVDGLMQGQDLSKADIVYYFHNEPPHWDDSVDHVLLGPESNLRQIEKRLAEQLKPDAVAVLIAYKDWGDVRFSDPRLAPFDVEWPGQKPLQPNRVQFYRKVSTPAASASWRNPERHPDYAKKWSWIETPVSLLGAIALAYLERHFFFPGTPDWSLALFSGALAGSLFYVPHYIEHPEALRVRFTKLLTGGTAVAGAGAFFSPWPSVAAVVVILTAAHFIESLNTAKARAAHPDLAQHLKEAA